MNTSLQPSCKFEYYHFEADELWSDERIIKYWKDGEAKKDLEYWKNEVSIDYRRLLDIPSLLIDDSPKFREYKFDCTSDYYDYCSDYCSDNEGSDLSPEEVIIDLFFHERLRNVDDRDFILKIAKKFKFHHFMNEIGSLLRDKLFVLDLLKAVNNKTRSEEEDVWLYHCVRHFFSDKEFSIALINSIPDSIYYLINPVPIRSGDDHLKLLEKIAFEKKPSIANKLTEEIFEEIKSTSEKYIISGFPCVKFPYKSSTEWFENILSINCAALIYIPDPQFKNDPNRLYTLCRDPNIRSKLLSEAFIAKDWKYIAALVNTCFKISIMKMRVKNQLVDLFFTYK